MITIMMGSTASQTYLFTDIYRIIITTVTPNKWNLIHYSMIFHNNNMAFWLNIMNVTSVYVFPFVYEMYQAHVSYSLHHRPQFYCE